MGNKYISPEMGFAMGINYVLLTGFTVPTEITAIGLMIGFWDESSTHVRNQLALSFLDYFLRNIWWPQDPGLSNFFLKK